jgi:hypothetical protein
MIKEVKMKEPFSDDLRIVLETLKKHKDGVCESVLFLENDIEYDSVQDMNFYYAKERHNRAVRNNAHELECAPNCPLGKNEEVITVKTVTGLKLFILEEKIKNENKRKNELEHKNTNSNEILEQTMNLTFNGAMFNLWQFSCLMRLKENKNKQTSLEYLFNCWDIKTENEHEFFNNLMYAVNKHINAINLKDHRLCALNCPLGDNFQIIVTENEGKFSYFLWELEKEKREKEVKMEIIEIEGEASFQDRIKPEDLLHKPFTGEIIASGSYKSKFTKAYEPWHLIRAESDDKEVCGTLFATPAMSRKLEKEGDIKIFHSRGLVKKVYAGKEYITFI